MWLATAAAGVAVPARGVLFLVAVAGQAVTVHEATASRARREVDQAAAGTPWRVTTRW